jgi:hypothetical protein
MAQTICLPEQWQKHWPVEQACTTGQIKLPGVVTVTAVYRKKKKIKFKSNQIALSNCAQCALLYIFFMADG